MKNAIALFDFDGTITFKDTLFDNIRFQKGKLVLYSGLIGLLPWLIAMKLRIISKTKAKERVLTYFFKGIPVEDFQKKCDEFIEKRLPQIIRTQAIEKINWHKQHGDTVVVVTASAQNWVEGWCKQYDIDCIATRLEVKENKITGKIKGENCNGIEKVNRIKERFEIKSFDAIFAYGDTNGDKEMLSLATTSFYKPFR